MKEIKHFFAGSISGSGFYNFLGQINDSDKKSMLFIIKGGPGTGKSSLMKKVGKHFFEAGEEIEFFHCASDPDSLDGVRLKKHNVAIVDGTSPHVIEPKMPGVKDKIIDVGRFIGPEIAKFERQIEKAMIAKKRYYEKAIHMLSLAKKEHAKLEEYYMKNMDFKELDILTEDLINEIENFIHP